MSDHDDVGVETELGGRLPLLDPATLDPEQRQLYDALVEEAVPWAERNGFRATTGGGRLIGPFNGFLHSPLLSAGYNGWIAAEQNGSVLPDRVRQIVILTVGSLWGAEYEIAAHVAVGRTAGLSDAVLDDVLSGRGPAAQTSPDEAAAFAFTRALAADHRVDDVVYARAVERFGLRGVVDMTHLIGQYLATSALLVAFEVPAPPG